jgi:WD40 repeat protein
MMKHALWMMPTLLFANAAIAQDKSPPWITSKQRITILSANDGQVHLRTGPDAKKVTQDSITVIHLGPDHPPIVKTVYGTVPNTISGPPYMAMTGDGRYGFVTSRKIKQEPDAPEIISVIDLASPDLKVVQTVKLPDPRMAVMHPDGKRLLIPYDTGIRVFEMRSGKLELVKDNPTDFRLLGIDISPRGDRVVGNGVKKGGKLAIHVLSYRDGDITYQSEVKIKAGLPDWDGPFACRFTPDGKRIVIPNGWHNGSRGTLAPVFIADLNLDTPTVTEVIPQVADGIEGVAIHPSGKFAVLSCLEDSPRLVHQAYSHLAVIDLSSKPARLLYHLDVESLPEGMEFSPDGSRLFVGMTYAHRIAVFDVDGFRLRRSPFVIRVDRLVTLHRCQRHLGLERRRVGLPFPRHDYPFLGQPTVAYSTVQFLGSTSPVAFQVT